MAAEQEYVSGGTGYTQPVISRAVIDEIKFYEITDSELEQLRDGGYADKYKAAAAFFLSTSISTTTSLLLAQPTDDTLRAYFISAIVFSFVLSVFLFMLYRSNYRKAKSTYDKILQRRVCSTYSITPTKDANHDPTTK